MQLKEPEHSGSFSFYAYLILKRPIVIKTVILPS